MTLRERLACDGFILVKSLFSKQELETARADILTFKSHTHTLLHNEQGLSIPDFLRFPDLHSVAVLKDSPELHRILRELFDGTDYRFCSHNDIGINRVVGWHKDKLNGPYAKYETLPIWSTQNGETHQIVKVLIYLQDTSAKDGLTVIPSSHTTPSMDTKGAKCIPTELGDVIIFDQRITHRGMHHQTPYPRILVSFGFGKNNAFTDEFELGTIARQKDQST